MAGIGAREEQEALGDAGEALGFLQQIEQELFLAVAEAAEADGRLELAADDGERGLQLVRGIGGEAHGLAKADGEPVDHVIEHVAEAAQLVIGERARAGAGRAAGR